MTAKNTRYLSFRKHNSTKQVVTRFAPSPTGRLHIGGLRTALLCHVYARMNGGRFILRIEDTDQKRFVDGSIEEIVKSLEAFNAIPDEGVIVTEDGELTNDIMYAQSSRNNLYARELTRLRTANLAYECKMTEYQLTAVRNKKPELAARELMLYQYTNDGFGVVDTLVARIQDADSSDYSFYEQVFSSPEAVQLENINPRLYNNILTALINGEKTGRWGRDWAGNGGHLVGGASTWSPFYSPSTWRLAMPIDGRTSWKELNGRFVSIQNNTLRDPVIMKGDDTPTYHLAHVVDDESMEVTTIIRGEEWISSTPYHIFLMKSLGYSMKEILHVPLILNPDGKGKLSKRRALEGIKTYAMEYAESDYHPDAVVKWLIQSVYNGPLDKEGMPIGGFITSELSSLPWRFDLDSLARINKEYNNERSVEWWEERTKKAIVDVLNIDGYDPSDSVVAGIAQFFSSRIKTVSDMEDYLSHINENGVDKSVDLMYHTLYKLLSPHQYLTPNHRPRSSKVILAVANTTFYNRPSKHKRELRNDIAGSKLSIPFCDLIALLSDICDHTGAKPIGKGIKSVLKLNQKDNS